MRFLDAPFTNPDDWVAIVQPEELPMSTKYAGGPSDNPETPGIMSGFELVLSELANMHAQKQKDYGTDADPYANVRGSTDWGIEPWVGAMVRANDKIKRLQKYARDGKLANESAEDSFIDLAVYAIIGLVLWREDLEGMKRGQQIEIRGQDCSGQPYYPGIHNYDPSEGWQ